MVRKFAPLTIIACVASAYLVSSQFADYNDLDDYQIYENGYNAIEDLAVGSTYFDPYTGEYEETYGDGFLAALPAVNDCHVKGNGSVSFNGVHQLSWRCQPCSQEAHSSGCLLAGTKACDVQIHGVDQLAPLLRGGMDGVYKLHSCKNGRPLYKRDTKDKPGECQQWYITLILAATKKIVLFALD